MAASACASGCASTQCRRHCAGGPADRFRCAEGTRRLGWRRSRHSAHAKATAPAPSGTASAPSSASSAPSVVPSASASECYAAARRSFDAGRQLDALTLLLRTQRLAAGKPGEEELCRAAGDAATQAYNVSPGLVPFAARRNGSLLCRETSGPGRRCPAARADGGDPSRPHKPASQKQGGPQPARRYESWLVGGEVPRVDCSSPSGFQQALDGYVSKHLPVVMEHLDVMPGISKWSLEYLRQHTNDWPGMNVLRSAGGDNRYLYYVPEQADRDMTAFRDAPRQASSDHLMSFSGFLSSAREDPGGRYYLQAPLVLRNADERGVIEENWSKGIDGTLRADCDRNVDRGKLEAIGAAGQFGHWSRSQLFVGPSDSLSPVHYDQYDNIYIQVEGEKHFLIFDPRAAEGLYPFPASHPYDEYAMVDLQNIDHKTFPRAKDVLEGRGAVVTLRPGESLFLPTHWWHHVQAGASTGHWSISVNFWFTIHRMMMEAPHPLPLHLELELSRHVELLLSDVCGSGQVARLAELLRADVDGEDRGLADVVSLPARNFILYRLARILGPENVRSFVHEQFPAERYERGAVLKALKGPARGGRERA